MSLAVPGAEGGVSALAAGGVLPFLHLFECLLHLWQAKMQTGRTVGLDRESSILQLQSATKALPETPLAGERL